jgi:hypothetical protein
MYKRVKKDTKWTIQNLGSFNVSALIDEVSSFNDEWFEDTSRQEKGMTHRNTFMYRLCATDYEWVPGTPIKTEYFNNLKTIDAQNELQDIYNKIEEYYSGKIIRCEIIKLTANSEVYKHTDGGAILHYSRRIHIPLITHKDVTFTVMDNTIHMEVGGWYEINNQLPHSVSNKSNIDRVHVIVDVLPDDMLDYH